MKTQDLMKVYGMPPLVARIISRDPSQLQFWQKCGDSTYDGCLKWIDKRENCDQCELCSNCCKCSKQKLSKEISQDEVLDNKEVVGKEYSYEFYLEKHKSLKIKKVKHDGTRILEFQDYGGQSCELLEVKPGFENQNKNSCIFFGVDSSNRIAFVETLTDTTTGVERKRMKGLPKMLLSQKQVKMLLPLLQFFAENGKLPK